MLKAWLAGAVATIAIAATPALAQTTIIKPLDGAPLPQYQGPRTYQEVVPGEAMTPGERAQVRRDWDQMAREWEQRQRSGYAPPQGSSMGAGGPTAYGGIDTRIAPSPQPPGPHSMMPMRGSGMQGLPQEPQSPVERAQVRRDWNEMAREWEQRQRSGYVPPADPVQPLPYQR